MRFKKDEITTRLNKVKKDYRQWKKEQKKKVELDLPKEYQPYEDVSEEIVEYGIPKWCLIFPIILIIASIILLILTVGKL